MTPDIRASWFFRVFRVSRIGIPALVVLFASGPPAPSAGQSPAQSPAPSGQDRSHAERPETLSDSLAFEILRQIAREDTLGLPPRIDYIFDRYQDVEDRRPTVKEIIGWSIEHEGARYRDVDDVSYLERLRVIEFYEPDEAEGRRRLVEELHRVYIVPPDEVIRVSIGERSWDSKEDEVETKMELEVRTSYQQLTRIPFFFEQLDDFDFEILERTILDDRILYKIGFTPRSDFKPLPEGWFLVDTGDFQIVRAEFALTNNVPFPVFIKAIDRVVMQRRKIQDNWFGERYNVVITLRNLPFMPIPRRVEVEVRVEDVVMNAGVPDSLRP